MKIKTKTFDAETIAKLCHKYTDYTKEEIEFLANGARYLPIVSEANECDVYIDIPNCFQKNEAIVVWEALSNESLRNVGFVGEKVYREDEPAVFRTLDIGLPTKDVLARSREKGGEVIWTRQNVVPIKMEERTLGVLILDVNTSQQEEDSRRIATLENEQSALTEVLLSILNASPDENDLLSIHEGILLFAAGGHLCYANNGAEQMYRDMGYRSILGMHFDDLTLLKLRYQDFIRERRAITEEVSFCGRYYRIRIVYVKNEEFDVLVTMEDISEYKNKAIELSLYLNSYRETQHRVKNNLQTIASLLRLQSRSCQSEEAKYALMDAINRTESIASIYEYYSDGMAEEQVSLLAILEKVKKNFDSLYANYYDVDIQLFGDDILLDNNYASTVTLIINELWQNSFKHAFQESKKGSITVSVSKEGNTCTISVIDDGEGFDCDRENPFGKGLGTSIIIGFVEDKLGGKWRLESGEKGTQFTFKFALK